MADADLTFINAAVTRIGQPPITSLIEGTVAANVCEPNYEQIVRASLTAYRWHFATTTRTLTALVDAPPLPWLKAYQLPVEEMILLRTIKQGGHTLAYEVASDKILTNADDSSGAEVVAHGIWRPAEVEWPAWFGEWIVIQLEAILLRAVGERYQEAEARAEAAARQFAMAKRQDAQSQPATNPVSSPTLQARYGTPGSRTPLTWWP